MLINPRIKNLNILNMSEVIRTPEISINFCVELGLVPRNEIKLKLHWAWRCVNRSQKKGAQDCSGCISPTKGIWFEDSRLPINCSLAIILALHWRIGVTMLLEHLYCLDDNCTISASTLCDMREVCEVISSNCQLLLDGPGCTVEADETFLTKYKYHRGRIIKTDFLTVFSIMCPENRQGIFFHVPSKAKCDLWPYLKRYVHPETSIICTDQGRQYCGVEKLFNEKTIHKTVNHSKYFVDPTDKENHINTQECFNKQLKKTIKSRKSLELIKQYMSIWFLLLKKILI